MFLKLAEYLDKVIMAAVALAAVVVAVFIFRDDIPALGKKYKEANNQAAKNNYGVGIEYDKDPKGMTTITVIQNGQIVSLRVTREEAARIRAQSR